MRRSPSSARPVQAIHDGLSTAIYLFGASYYYGYFGTTSLAPLVQFAATNQAPDHALAIALYHPVTAYHQPR